MNQFSRTEILVGSEKLNKIKNARIAVFGIGGVGSYVVEALVRSGFSKIDLYDNDTVSLTNINRQLIADFTTIGKYKVDVAKERILNINKDAEVNCFKYFVLRNEDNEIDFSVYDYIIDAVDTVTAKLTIIESANRLNIPVISSMGTGNKVDPTRLEVTDIYKTSVCPLARVMRTELKKRGIKKLTVVYSKEEPIKPKYSEDYYLEETQSSTNAKRDIPGSTAFVPSVAGLMIASVVFNYFIKD